MENGSFYVKGQFLWKMAVCIEKGSFSGKWQFLCKRAVSMENGSLYRKGQFQWKMAVSMEKGSFPELGKRLTFAFPSAQTCEIFFGTSCPSELR